MKMHASLFYYGMACDILDLIRSTVRRYTHFSPSTVHYIP